MGEVIPLESRRRNRESRRDAAPLRAVPAPEPPDRATSDRPPSGFSASGFSASGFSASDRGARDRSTPDRGTPDGATSASAPADRVLPDPVAGTRPTGPTPATEPLWREVLGRRLRDLRRARGERLADTATRAGISPQYLSELERGRKDPSSEILAAVAGALGVSLRQVVGLAHTELVQNQHVRTGLARADRARGAHPRGPVLLAA